MKTEEELKTLYNKFDRDIATKSYWLRLAIAIDQVGNVLFLNGSNDETISSNIHRKQEANKSNWFLDKLCCFLSKLEYNHCYKSRGE